jgi:hypothetical protein
MAVSTSESKYEALKNTQELQKQLAECCCEIKIKVDGVGNKVDDTLRTLDSQRLRDALNTANNEVNLLKLAEHTRPRFADPFGGGYGPRSFNNYYSSGGKDDHHGGGGPGPR